MFCWPFKNSFSETHPVDLMCNVPPKSPPPKPSRWPQYFKHIRMRLQRFLVEHQIMRERANDSLKAKIHHLQQKVALLEQHKEGLIRENQQLKQEMEENFLYQQALNDEYQATFLEQSYLLERRQAYIGKLELKIQDLMDDVKDFFCLDSKRLRTPPQVCAPSSRNFSLKLLNDLKQMAFKIENIHVPSSMAEFYEEPLVHYHSLECRQLFDVLREEELGLLFIYCPCNQRVIFAHPLFREWTGYHGGEFFSQREKIIVSNSHWLADEQIRKQGHSHGQLLVQVKQSGKRWFHYAVLTLNKGLFHHHYLGLLHPMIHENK